jgi:anti-sigma regulatory factor (Ser/Thr protein kinase)
MKTSIIELKRLEKNIDTIGFINKVNETFPSNSIDIDFSNISKVFSKVAVPVSGQIYQLRNSYKKAITCKNLNAYLKNIGICEPVSYLNDGTNKLGKILILESDKVATDYVGEVINELYVKFTASPDFFEALNWILFEIIDNALRHSESSPVFCMVEHHPKSKHIACAIFDYGIGIYASLSKSKIYRPKDALESLQIAVDKGVTKGDGQGFGLYGMQRLVRNNKGSFTIISSGVGVSVTESGKLFQSVKRIDTKFSLGCLVEFQLDYENEINLITALDGHRPTYLRVETEKMEDDSGYVKFVVKEKPFGVSSRPAGNKMRNELLNLIRVSNNRIAIDFGGIPLISSSFADEFIAKSMVELGPVQFNQLIRLKNVNTTISNLIETAFIERMKNSQV